MLLEDSFLTIATRHSSEIKIERSRFIGTVIPASSRDLAELEYDRVKKAFYDATHNCFAFCIGLEPRQEYRYSDDGEPSGTAGRPIYDAILSHKVTDLLVVVTRYFGGIKLGTGGLARAYRHSADQVLSEAVVVEKMIMQPFKISYGHDHTSIIMKALSDFELRPGEIVYGEGVVLHTAIRASRYSEFCRSLRERAHGQASIESTGEPHA